MEDHHKLRQPDAERSPGENVHQNVPRIEEPDLKIGEEGHSVEAKGVPERKGSVHKIPCSEDLVWIGELLEVLPEKRRSTQMRPKENDRNETKDAENPGGPKLKRRSLGVSLSCSGFRLFACGGVLPARICHKSEDDSGTDPVRCGGSAMRSAVEGQIYAPNGYRKLILSRMDLLSFSIMTIRRASSPPSEATSDDLFNPTDDPVEEERTFHTGRPVPTVSQLTRQISDVLDGEFGDVTVQGEISGLTRASSGHTYFTLKDDGAVLSCVLWRTRRVETRLENGMKVVAEGRISLYAPRGQYQLDCTSVQPVGLGDLQAAFEALKRKLSLEGLFEQSRKRTLPEFPRRIGVVTSRTGAAWRDIMSTLQRRMPLVEVIFRPALVQGTSAASDIATAIRELNDVEGIEVLIVGRGGGSIEDLWAFNEERVARAIAASAIPVVSAVGHETDFTIADFVADVRAATPTAAAELVVRDRGELIPALMQIERTMGMRLSERIARRRRELATLVSSRGLSRPLDLVHNYAQRVDDLTHRGERALQSAADRSRSRLELLESTLRALSPENVLARGYAIIERDGEPVTRAAALSGGEHLRLRFVDGSMGATVDPTETTPTTDNR